MTHEANQERLSLSTAHYVFHDFEYGYSHYPILGHFLHFPSSECHTIDFRNGQGIAALTQLQQRWSVESPCVWSSFAVMAEMTCFLKLGLDIDQMLWLDLFAEARQITASHTHFYSRKGGLIQACQALGVPTGTSEARKEAMRLRILERDPNSHSPEDWADIVRYNIEDVEVLPALWQAITEVHLQRRKSYPLKAALFRTEYLKALAGLEFRSRGFPLDVDATNLIFDNHKLVRKYLAEQCNERYGGKVFRYAKKEDKYSLHLNGLVEYVDSLPYPVNWKLTETGRLNTSADYLDELVKQAPVFRELRDTLNVLSQLKQSNLREQMDAEGFVKGVSIPYYTVTGRNQPLTSRGFVLNLPPWLRHVVRPKRDHVLIVGDWSQQEIYLAAALSEDYELRDALLTGDVYIALAKMAGSVPEDATKDTHPAQRQAYKSTQLGVGYGMGAVSLGKRIFMELPPGSNLDFEECMRMAVDILRWHKQTFRSYWQFVDREVFYARKDGWVRAKDGWTQFADLNSKFTVLQNFPMQANGAVILREAVKLLAAEPVQVELVCTLHDSIMLYCHEDDRVIHENILRRCMQQAANTVMAATPMPMEIPVKVTVFDHTTGYQDERGTEMYHRVLKIIQDASK